MTQKDYKVEPIEGTQFTKVEGFPIGDFKIDMVYKQEPSDHTAPATEFMNIAVKTPTNDPVDDEDYEWDFRFMVVIYNESRIKHGMENEPFIVWRFKKHPTPGWETNYHVNVRILNAIVDACRCIHKTIENKCEKLYGRDVKLLHVDGYEDKRDYKEKLMDMMDITNEQKEVIMKIIKEDDSEKSSDDYMTKEDMLKRWDKS